MNLRFFATPWFSTNYIKGNIFCDFLFASLNDKVLKRVCSRGADLFL